MVAICQGISTRISLLALKDLSFSLCHKPNARLLEWS